MATGCTLFWTPVKVMYSHGGDHCCAPTRYGVCCVDAVVWTMQCWRPGARGHGRGPLPYLPTHSKCMHFALHLLSLGPSLESLQIELSPLISVSTAQLLTHNPICLPRS